MPGQSIFADEWRDCLKAHYSYIVREQDARTERTLRGVMHNVGFTDDELNELRLRATMHVDDVGVEFVPDLEILKAVEEAAIIETTEVGVQRVSDLPVGAPLPTDVPPEEVVDMEASEEPEAEEPVPYDESGPAQLSLF